MKGHQATHAESFGQAGGQAWAGRSPQLQPAQTEGGRRARRSLPQADCAARRGWPLACSIPEGPHRRQGGDPDTSPAPPSQGWRKGPQAPPPGWSKPVTGLAVSWRPAGEPASAPMAEADTWPAPPTQRVAEGSSSASLQVGRVPRRDWPSADALLENPHQYPWQNQTRSRPRHREGRLNVLHDGRSRRLTDR